jgi:quinol---cytochrome c reductase cytochrome b subunit, bacillus type
MKLLPGPRRRRGNGAEEEKKENGNGNGDGVSSPLRRGNAPDKEAKEREKQANRERLKKSALEVPIATVAWLDERTGGGPFLRGFLYRKVPKGTNWYYTLGSATMFAFLAQAVTGVFLAMYYRPSATEAYASVQHINDEVFAGLFVRGMHKWGATVMVILIFLHMGRTFFFGAYKYPRELNWIIGVVLLILTMAMALTGYLLPFDQRSFWATVVAANITGTGPIVGPYLADFLRGGAEFGATTLSRFYAIHMLLIPGLIAALIGAHLFLVAKLGTTAPPWLKAEKARDLAREDI